MVRAANSRRPHPRYHVGPHAQSVTFEELFPDQVLDIGFEMFKRFL